MKSLLQLVSNRQSVNQNVSNGRLVSDTFCKIAADCMQVVSRGYSLAKACEEPLNHLDYFDSSATRALNDVLRKSRISQLTPIQQLALAHLDGRKYSRCILYSPTGTGKTLAFLLPLFSKLLAKSKVQLTPFPQALIVVPNSDLALQTLHFAQRFGAPLGIHCSMLGSVDFAKTLGLSCILSEQQKDYKKKHGSLTGYREIILEPDRFPQTNVMITTIGKLAQHDFKKIRHLVPRINHFVFDEMDFLLDGGDRRYSWQFFDQIRAVLDADNSTLTPIQSSIQSLIGSCATLPKHCRKDKFLSTFEIVASNRANDLKRVEGQSSSRSGAELEENQVSNATKMQRFQASLPAQIRHQFIEAFISASNRDALDEDFYFDSSIPFEQKMVHKKQLESKVNDNMFKAKLDAFLNFCQNTIIDAKGVRMLIFFNGQTSMEKVFEAVYCKNYLLNIRTLHAATSVQDRQQILEQYCQHNSDPMSIPELLFCTGVASRGIDFQDVNLVINFDFPTNLDDYIHRAGRTGRMNKAGHVVSFIDNNEAALALKIEKTLIHSQSSYSPNKMLLRSF